MKTLINGISSYLSNLSYSTKFKLLVLLTIFISGFVSIQIYFSQNIVIQNIKNNAIYVEYISSLMKLGVNIVDYYGALADFVNGGGSSAQVLEKEQAVDKNLKFLFNYQNNLENKLSTRSKITQQLGIDLLKLDGKWNETKYNFKNGSGSYADIVELLTLLKIITSNVKDYSYLTLSIDIALNRLVEGMAFNLQSNQMFLNDFLAQNYAYLNEKAEFDRPYLYLLKEGIIKNQKYLSGNLQGAIEVNPQLSKNLVADKLMQNYFQQNRTMDSFLDSLQKLGGKEGDNEALKKSISAANESAREAVHMNGALADQIGAAIIMLTNAQLNTLYFRLYSCLALVLLGSLSVTNLYLTRSIRLPLIHLRKATDELSNGNLDARLETKAGNELLEISNAFNNMADYLENIINETRKICDSILATAFGISTAAKELEQQMHFQEKTIQKITTNTRGICLTVQECADMLQDVNQSAIFTSKLAIAGKINLMDLELIMQQLIEASDQIVASLSGLQEKTSNINLIIKTIVKIADQANLLALNSSIRTNNSGVKGSGFKIIAEKISELGDQTAYVTLNIEQEVKEIFFVLKEAVVKVENFSAEIKEQVSEIRKVSDLLGKLINNTHRQMKTYEAIGEDMKDQAKSAIEINATLLHINEIAKQTTQSTNKFGITIESLYNACNTLDEIVKDFVKKKEKV